MEGGTLTTELLKRFGCSLDTAFASALVQQRSKLAPETFPALFDLFVRKTHPIKLYKGFRLFAADGSDIQIPNNPGHISSHYLGANGQAPYNILHLDAIYDLLQCTYQDASLVGDREANEQASLCRMVDRSAAEKALIIMDRGYEGYNLLAQTRRFFRPWSLKSFTPCVGVLNLLFGNSNILWDYFIFTQKRWSTYTRKSLPDLSCKTSPN